MQHARPKSKQRWPDRENAGEELNYIIVLDENGRRIGARLVERKRKRAPKPSGGPATLKWSSAGASPPRHVSST